MDDTSRPHTARKQFAPEGVYLNTATHGLLPRRAVLALRRHTDEVASGRFQAVDANADIEAARSAYARLAGVPASLVAAGTHTSQFVGTIARSLPEGARVLTAEGEYGSAVHPLMADGRLTVEQVPLERLPDQVGPGTDLVAVSAVQSSNGAVAPVDDLVTACADHGARLMLDTTQSAGWLPVPADRVDFTVCSTFKWLLGPRGGAYLTATPEALDTLRPLAPNPFACARPWESLYGGPHALAEDARRLDLGPVWSAWIGLAPALELLEEVGVPTIGAHNAALGDRLRTAMGLEPAGSAIVSLKVGPETAERVRAAGIATAERDGRLRASFHLYNDESDVDRLVRALR
ncbi:aminotransferase class V-fold PLP-dependent enzyme [Nocardiopsis sp. CNT312]|uniref:aminotransferase class V-fold PLP-dependent enzyme n=1 Tax=Nocardiopsis sp. CNT312 TaxID=1137268 RepID=UPI00048C2BCB|nr:aminotransferase class V-fold PLP-dependent enzyme [Nocardiopsis sp. CNT312]